MRIDFIGLGLIVFLLGFFAVGLGVGFFKIDKTDLTPKTIIMHVKNNNKRQIKPNSGEVAVINHLALILAEEKHGFLYLFVDN